MIEISLENLLRWAYCVQRVDAIDSEPDFHQSGGSGDGVATLMRRDRLGCKVDNAAGGGLGRGPHVDAITVASMIGTLPSMADRDLVIHWARVGSRPPRDYRAPFVRGRFKPSGAPVTEHNWPDGKVCVLDVFGDTNERFAKKCAHYTQWPRALCRFHRSFVVSPNRLKNHRLTDILPKPTPGA